MFDGCRQHPQWREELCTSVKECVLRYEPRLQDPGVKATMEEQSQSNGKSLRVRRCLHIEINGTLSKTNETFNFRDTIYISPVAQQ